MQKAISGIIEAFIAATISSFVQSRLVKYHRAFPVSGVFRYLFRFIRNTGRQHFFWVDFHNIMLKQEYFIKLLEKKKINEVVKKDIISSGMFISQSVLASYIKHYKGANEYKQHAVLKDKFERNLGPGRYPTPPPPKSSSFMFNITPRFSDSKPVQLLGNRSVGNIKTCDRLPKLEDNKINQNIHNKSTITISNKKQKKKIEGILSKRTKEIINSEKRENLIRVIREKQLRAEYRKDATIKDSICHTLTTLALFIFIPCVLKRKFDDTKLYKLKIKKYSRFVMIIARALGKFKRSYRRASTKKGWSVLKKKLPVYLKLWQQKWIMKFFGRINSIVELYLDKFSCFRIMSSLTSRIVYLQRRIRNYLVVTRSRKYCLRLFWTKCNRTKTVVPIEIKMYYIDKYLNKKLTDHYYSMNNDKRLIFLLSLNQHQEIIEDIRNAWQKKPFLRIFLKKSMLELIKLANDSKRLWKALVPDLDHQQVLILEKSPDPDPIPALQTKSTITRSPGPKKKLRYAAPLDSIKSSPFLRKPTLRTRTIPPKS